MNVQEALKTLSEAGYAWKAWSIQDVKDRIQDRINCGDLSLPAGVELDELADDAANTGWFNSLSESTDSDWERIDYAIDESL